MKVYRRGLQNRFEVDMIYMWLHIFFVDNDSQCSFDRSCGDIIGRAHGDSRGVVHGPSVEHSHSLHPDIVRSNARGSKTPPSLMRSTRTGLQDDDAIPYVAYF